MLQPWQRRAVRRWCRRAVRLRGLRLFIQRGRRGWHDEDLWQFDDHMARVIAGGFRQLADTTHGRPMDEAFPAFEDWQRFLLDVADDLDAWVRDDDDSFLDRKRKFDRAREAMHRVADQYGHYWT